MYSDAVYLRSLTLKMMVTSAELCTVIPVSMSLNYFHGLESEKKSLCFTVLNVNHLSICFAFYYFKEEYMLLFYYYFSNYFCDRLALSVCLSLSSSFAFFLDFAWEGKREHKN